MIVHKCDGCLQEVSYFDVKQVQVPDGTRPRDLDFCRDCYRKVMDFISKMRPQTLAETPQT